MHRGNCEVILNHFLGQPFDLTDAVAENHGLGDCETVIQIAESVKLPSFFFNRNEKLLDALKCELVSFHQDLDGVVHELLAHVKNLIRQCCTYNHHLSPRRKEPINLLNLVPKPFCIVMTSLQHLISLIQNEKPDLLQVQVPLLNHVEHSSRGSAHDMHTHLKTFDVLLHRFSSDTSVNLHVEMVAQSRGYLL